MGVPHAWLVSSLVLLVSCAAHRTAPLNTTVAQASAAPAVIIGDDPARHAGPGVADATGEHGLDGPPSQPDLARLPLNGLATGGENEISPVEPEPSESKSRQLPPEVQLPLEPSLASLPAARRPAPILAIEDQWAKGHRFKARQQLESVIQAGRGVPIEVRMHGRVLLAELLRRGNPKRSDELYEQAIRQWRNPAKELRHLQLEEPDVARRRVRIEQILDALGEAQVHLAEHKRQRALKLRMPKYSGPANGRSGARFVFTEVKAWLDDKTKAIGEVDEAYVDMVRTKPSPSPRWVIVAGLRSAVMWADLVRELRDAPAPSSWRKTGQSRFDGVTWEEIRAHYRQSLVDASAPQLNKALSAARTCCDYSMKYQLNNAFSRSCADWLKTDPR